MFLHIGGDVTVSSKSIIGIFDLEKVTTSKISRDFLRMAEQEGFVDYVSLDMPKSFILTDSNNKCKVFVSNVSSSTLKKRSQEKFSINCE